MLFTDGNRIDLHLEMESAMRKDYGSDFLMKPLFDKKNVLPVIVPSSDRSYWVPVPIEGEYTLVRNDFWWCAQNVGKGLVKNELPYAKEMQEMILRKQLNQMLFWEMGIENDFQVSLGKWENFYNDIYQLKSGSNM